MIEKIRDYRLEITAATVGAVVLMYELVGARIFAPYFGTSIFVWTALIGTILGALALALPLFLTLARLAWTARTGAVQRTGFALVLVLVLYSFGENLEILAYLFWPALILFGKALAASPTDDASNTQ